MPGQRCECACQDRCRDPAASALTINRRDGVDSERQQEMSGPDKIYLFKSKSGSPQQHRLWRTTLMLMMEFPVSAARWRNRKGGLVINN